MNRKYYIYKILYILYNNNNIYNTIYETILYMKLYRM